MQARIQLPGSARNDSGVIKTSSDGVDHGGFTEHMAYIARPISPMSWERGSQLQTTAPFRGSSQSYMDVRLASSASRERAMPRGVPVLPEVNCTKLPGASAPPGRPAATPFAERMRGNRSGGQEGRQPRVAEQMGGAGEGAHGADLGQVFLGVHASSRVGQ